MVQELLLLRVVVHGCTPLYKFAAYLAVQSAVITGIDSTDAVAVRLAGCLSMINDHVMVAVDTREYHIII